jgi:hypothetical protein
MLTGEPRPTTSTSTASGGPASSRPASAWPHSGRITRHHRADRADRVDRADEVWTSRAFRRIEAEVSLDSHRSFLMDEHWYEIDQEYLKAIRSHAERLITGSSFVDLPPWVFGVEERTSTGPCRTSGRRTSASTATTW